MGAQGLSANTLQVLLVEDDYQLGDVVHEYLDISGIAVTHKLNAQDGLDALSHGSFDCVILDLNLPDEDGLVVLRKIRSASIIPVIVCSARGEVEDRIVGLEFGATDYLSKPYSVKELLLRIKAHASRYTKDETSQQDLKVQHILLDTEKKQLRCLKREKDIPLTLKEFMIIKQLAQKVGRVYSRAELIDAVSGVEGPESERAMDVAITRLRKKVEVDPKHPQIIMTSVGFGYYLNS